MEINAKGNEVYVCVWYFLKRCFLIHVLTKCKTWNPMAHRVPPPPTSPHQAKFIHCCMKSSSWYLLLCQSCPLATHIFCNVVLPSISVSFSGSFPYLGIHSVALFDHPSSFLLIRCPAHIHFAFFTFSISLTCDFLLILLFQILPFNSVPSFHLHMYTHIKWKLKRISVV